MDTGAILYFFPLKKLGEVEKTRASLVLDLSLALPPRRSLEQANSKALNKPAIDRLTVLGTNLHMYKMRNLGVVNFVVLLFSYAFNSLGVNRSVG